MPTSPYSATWNAASASVATHTVTGTAFDAAGNSAASSVQVTIVAPTPPPAGVKNVALAANGGAVTAYSHQFNERGYAQYVIDGKKQYDTPRTGWWVKDPGSSESVTVKVQ